MKTKSSVIAYMTDAITAVVDGHDEQAVKLMMKAVREIQAPAISTTPRKVGRPVGSTNKKKQWSRKPVMNPAQVAAMLQRVQQGETVVGVAKSMGVKPQTAYKYIARAKAQA